MLNLSRVYFGWLLKDFRVHRSIAPDGSETLEVWPKLKADAIM
jgi:hypothetical protein